MSATAFTAIFDGLPILRPLLSPGKWPLTNQTFFFR